MKITEQNIIAELERMAECFPWDQVQLSVNRQPEGKYAFTVYIPTNEKLGMPYLVAGGETPAEAVNNIIQSGRDRDPETMRKKKIAELQDQIAKLQAVVIGLPPYRPNRELSNGEPAIRANETVNV